MLILVVSACAVDKQSLGIGRKTPDEFVVMKRQLLSMPPEYNLAPPEPGKAPLKQAKPEAEAEKVLYGTEENADNITEDDGAFLDELRTNVYHPNIRNMLDEELINDPANNKYLIDNLMFWKERENAVILDNLEEAKRIKYNKKQGRSIDEGDVPVIKPGE